MGPDCGDTMDNAARNAVAAPETEPTPSPAPAVSPSPPVPPTLSAPAGPLAPPGAPGAAGKRGAAGRRPLHTLLVALALLGILFLGAAFRLTDLRWDGEAGHLVLDPWDEGKSLHPDERFLTMVAMAIRFPEPCQGLIPRLNQPEGAPELPKTDLQACVAAYFDTAQSTLNPRNVGHSLWVYGSLPMILFRAIVDALHITGFSEVTEAGRVLSAVVDLATILVTFFLARRLLGSRAGLLAALFLALSVLNIQNAHFFTVDIITAFEVLLCVYLAVVIAEGKGSWGTFVLLGLFFGLAVASKINVATFALVIAIAGVVRVWRRVQEKGDEALWPELLRTGAGLFLAAVLSVVVFRVAQPDAFVGPGLLDVQLETRYKDNLATVQGLVGGEVDYYPSHQWTERTALVFPWTNMVVWGLGLPLGLAAWAGIAWAGWRLVRRRDLRLVVPLAWTLLLFVYQGIQFVKTMRYFLPIYPLLGIFAAYLLITVWDWARAAEPAPPLPRPPAAGGRGRGRAGLRTLLAGALLAVVVLGTLAWAWGFIQIYRRPVTRLTASRWVFQNLTPTQGAWLTMSDGTLVPITVPSPQAYMPGMVTETDFTPAASGTATQLTLAHLQDLTESPGPELLQVTLCADRDCRQVLAQAAIQGDFSGAAGDSAPGIAELPPTHLEAGHTYYLRLMGQQGSLCLWAVALANEHWDDAVPYNVDGNAAFGPTTGCTATYRGLTLMPYAEDTPDKVEELLHQLANTDYILLTSNRLYDSIPRLPMRYPVTTRYYRYLLDGSLGYERVATFTSFPTLLATAMPSGTAALSDEERAAQGRDWGGIVLPDQGAEEAFSVYDHPVVLILRRTENFDLSRARTLLTEGIAWDKIARIQPKDVPGYWARLSPEDREWVRQGNTPRGSYFLPTGGGWMRQGETSPGGNDLLLTAEEWAIQRAGGTWTDIFPASGWPTKVALPLWLLVIEVLGLATWPLAHFLLGRLRDGGYLPAKALGILLLGYFSWLLAATKVLPFTRGTILLVLALLAVLGGVVGWFRRRELLEIVRARRKLLLLEEGVFLAGFLLFLLIRFGNPDVWHPWFGGEKPMDLAYLTAIIRSTTFPPYDPWFSGGYLNYYYFGQVLIATLIKLTGIVPAVAYNLALPLLYGLVCGGAFTVVYHLVIGRKESADGWYRPAVYSALAGAAFVALLGNLGQFMLIMGRLGALSTVQIESHIPGLAGLVRAVTGIPQALRDGLGIGDGTWYWDASRVIVGEGRGNEINEFPFFTFLYADLHAHMIAMPFTLLLLTQVVALAQGRERVDRSLLGLLPPPWVVFGIALVLGTLRAANFWDFPTYLLVALGGWAIVLYERRRRIDWQLLLGLGALAGLLYWLSSFLLTPFWARYGTYYNSVELWKGQRTFVWEYVVINGLALFILITYLVAEALGRDAREGPLHLLSMVARYWDRLPALFRRIGRFRRRGVALPLLLVGVVFLLAVVLHLFIPLPQVEGQPPPDGLLQRLRGQPVVAWMVIFMVLGAVLLLRRRATAAQRLVALLALAGLGISAGVEIIVVKGDIARQNTFFKFYMQIWILWGVAAAAMLPRLWARMRAWPHGARGAWRTVLGILIALCALYPLLAAPAKVRDRFPGTTLGPSLDGEAFMSSETYGDANGPIVLAEDAAAVAWLRQNVVGSPVILEAPSGIGNVTGLYRWGSRIAIHTGLPSVIGWDWHQRQQRGAAVGAGIEMRMQDAADIYNGLDAGRAAELLHEYEVEYVVVGQVERYYYLPDGIAKFERMVGTYLERVYPADGTAGTVIYRVLP